MEDMPCIYNLSLIKENDSIKEDIVKGKTLDILVELLSGGKTIKEIAKLLKISNVQVNLYLNRLIQIKLVKVGEVKVSEGKVEKTYELATTNIQIMNYLKENSKDDEELNVELAAEHFASLTKEAVLNIKGSLKDTYKVKSFFIRADAEKIKQFKLELEELYNKFEKMENLDAKNTYEFISVLAPYEINEEGGEEK